MGSETGHRRFERFPIECTVMIERLDEPREGAFCATRDLSRGGCSVTLPEPVEGSGWLRLYIALDHEVLEAESRVVHARRLEEGRYAVGLEFLKVDPFHRAVVQQVLG